MRVIRVFIKKEFLQIRRTREMLAIIFMVPIIQLFLLGYAITTDVKHVPLLICDLDKSQSSREIVRAFQHTGRFDVVQITENPTEAGHWLKKWQAQVALIIPRHFHKKLIRGQKPVVQILLDGVDGNTAGVARGYAEGILLRLAKQWRLPYRWQSQWRGRGRVTVLERFWYNLDLDTTQFMIPGIVVMLLTIITMMLTAMSLVREREMGTLEQLMVTPLKKHQLLIGKILPFLILTSIELFIVLVIAQINFSVHMAGSYLLFAVVAVVYLFTTLGLGILVSTLATTQQQAMYVSWFFMVFMVLMSGFFIPIENMPVFLQKLTYVNPMRYMMEMVRDLFLKGSTLRYLWKDLFPLAGFGIAIFSAGIVKFHKHLS